MAFLGKGPVQTVWAGVIVGGLVGLGACSDDGDAAEQGNDYAGSGGLFQGSGGMAEPGAGGNATCTSDTCGGACVDLDSNAEHCGGCNVSCESFEACLSGTCVRVQCDEPLTLCEEECFDTQADVLHCGDCGVQCALTFECHEGDCACSGERIVCDDYCAHPLFDRSHCGNCGSPCGSDEACVQGDCQIIGIPDNAYCEGTLGWAAARTAMEFEILDIVNRRRAEGATCGDRGYFPPVPPLQMDASLRCAARMHSQDMVDRNFFSHTSPNPGGTTVGQRLTAAGYSGSRLGENIAAGRSTAEQTMAQWMNSDGHCANIMSANYDLLGVGYAPNNGNAQYGHYWTQTFGR